MSRPLVYSSVSQVFLLEDDDNDDDDNDVLKAYTLPYLYPLKYKKQPKNRGAIMMKKTKNLINWNYKHYLPFSICIVP